MTGHDTPGFESHENEWNARISAYLDVEQSPEERAVVEEHIVTCPACAKLLDDYQRVIDRLKSDPPSVPGRHVLDGVLSAIDARVQAPIARRRLQLRRWGLAAAAAAASVAVIIYDSSPHTNRTPETGPAPQSVIRSNEVPPAESYARAVNRLERDITDARDVLGSRALGELQQSLAVIDRALEDAEAARSADPGNTSLVEYVRGIQELRLATMRAVASNIEGRREALRS